MKNFKVIYRFSGYKFFDYVQAETPEQAGVYLKWIKESEEDYKIISVIESDEIPSYYCPAGWSRPESTGQARARCYVTWLNAYLKDFIKEPSTTYHASNLVYSKELEEFLLKDGWKISNEDGMYSTLDLDPYEVVFKRGDQTIYAVL